ncbi:MAG: hypothetical protein A49_29970 [Methyloceanibacter sp.]|nr:MAG: hypothetical protein A49_29970 [Methyloceanibacter sp.]
MIDGLHEDVVDVEQQTASGSADDGAQELDLAHRRLGIGHIGRWIFEKHWPRHRIVHFVDVIADAGERCIRIGQRKKIVQIDGVVTGPREMLGKEAGLIAVSKGAQA